MKTIRMITSPFPLVLTFGAIIALALTGNLFAASPILVTVQAAAVALNLWARISFQKGTFRVTAAPGGARIITCGPYRIIRHPMYSAVLVLIWVGVASHLSLFTLAIAIAITAVVLVRITAEEQLLRARYPEYLDYARSTRTLIPFVL